MKRNLLVLITLFLISAFNSKADWQQCDGPYGGYITCIANNGSNMYAGTYNGVYLSTLDSISTSPIELMKL